MKSVLYAPTDDSLMYAMVATWLDNPSRSHWNAFKHMFRYQILVSTKEYDILLSLNDTSGIVSYTDLNFVGCMENRKSKTRYCFKFRNGKISWKSKLQHGRIRSHA